MSGGQRSAWVGVDVGEARVGIAVSEDGRLAVPHATFEARDASERLLDLLERLQTQNVVVGWPLDLAGREGEATRRVERFVERLTSAADQRGATLHVEYRDERMTTGLAEALLNEAGVRGRKRKKVVDQLAATQILQQFLDEGTDGE